MKNVIPAEAGIQACARAGGYLFPLKQETRNMKDSYPDRSGFLLPQE